MNPLKKLLKDALYLLPRLILFSVIVLCLVITLVVSVDAFTPYRTPLRELRGMVARMLGL